MKPISEQELPRQSFSSTRAIDQIIAKWAVQQRRNRIAIAKDALEVMVKIAPAYNNDFTAIGTVFPFAESYPEWQDDLDAGYRQSIIDEGMPPAIPFDNSVLSTLGKSDEAHAKDQGKDQLRDEEWRNDGAQQFVDKLTEYISARKAKRQSDTRSNIEIATNAMQTTTYGISGSICENVQPMLRTISANDAKFAGKILLFQSVVTYDIIEQFKNDNGIVSSWRTA